MPSSDDPTQPRINNFSKRKEKCNINTYNAVRREKTLKKEGFKEHSLIPQKAIVLLKPMQYWKS